jgi:hydroxyacylglutathione hydrolase
MLNITTLILGELDTNCHLIWCDETSETAIIDPADSGDFITEKILDLHLTPTAIILTHGHYDHCLACLELKLNFRIPILIHQDDLFLYQKANRSANYYGNFKSDPLPPPDNFLKDKQIIDIGHEKLTVIHTPGHTPGSICLYSMPYLFSGDTLFSDGVGRTDLSYSDPQKLQSSLKKLTKLPENTQFLSGHGESTYIKNTQSNYPSSD